MGFEYRTLEKDKHRLDQIVDSESGFQNQRPFEKKLGIQVIEPGGRLERRFSMRFN